MIENVRKFRKSLRRVEREFIGNMKSETTCCGVSISQCHAILEIEDLGEATISKISRNLRIDKSTLSRTIDNMVKLGWVERFIDPRDRRFMRVRLSAQGNKVCEHINKLCDQFYLTVLQHIPKQKHAAVLESLENLVSAFSCARTDKNKTCNTCDI